MNVQVATNLLSQLFNRDDAFGSQAADGQYTAVRAPLEDASLRAHLLGRVRIGAYAMAPDDTSRWGVLDTDQGGAAPVLDLRDALRQLGIPFVVEKSKSKGHHV